MSEPTSNHDQMIAWASRHEATPAEVIPRVFDREPAILHFLFGEARVGLPEIRPISWESFFAQFDLMELAIVFDDSPTFQIVRNEKVSIYRPSSGIS